MAPFYARYVPTANVESTKSTQETPVSPAKKRKLGAGGNEYPPETKKSRKVTRRNHSPRRGDLYDPDPEIGSLPPQSAAHAPGVVSGNCQRAASAVSHGDGATDQEQPEKKEDRGLEKNDRESGDPEPSKSNGKSQRNRKESRIESSTQEIDKAKRRKRKKEKIAVAIEAEGFDEDQSQLKQHASVRSKFKKATKASVPSPGGTGQEEEREQREHSEPKDLHGLEPLPQPLPVQTSPEKPSFSSLPPWLAHPLRVDPGWSADFSDLGLDPAVLENIKQQGLDKAFAVQSAVIPLLLDGANRHRGDVCISAATGSGKTLAYVLPLMQKLRKLASTKLRVLIVVPTRELVKQAKETCEACSAGTNVKISTALGNKPLSDEQDALVERYEVWNPEAYEAQQNAVLDWSEITLESVIADIEDESGVSPDFVRKYRSKVDVLICTPGRLVDHLRSTKGFTLDDVEWLVIDEADRLLNESFQEWIDVITPALESRASYSIQDRVLLHMRLELRPRIVQKVMLSATMTRDISKLNSLKLQNPRLVVIGGPSAEIEIDTVDEPDRGLEEDEEHTFDLPSTLAEYAVPVGDGAEKPLFLLELLRSKIDVFSLQRGGDERTGNAAETDNTSSTSDSSESDSESMSSSSISTSSNTESSRPKDSKQRATPPSKNSSSEKNNTALIFTRSTESAIRLSRLLSLLSKPIASLTATLTKSSTTSSSSRRALADLRNGKICVIIATDRASRGLDLPELGHVISYDVPTSATSYVHRVGRTARAGKAGKAWTLLAHREARWFWNEIGKVEKKGKGAGKEGRVVRDGKVQRCQLNLDAGGENEETRRRYERALKQLGEEVAGEIGSKAT